MAKRWSWTPTSTGWGGNLAWQDRPPPRKTIGTGTIYNDEEVGNDSRVVVSDANADEADGPMVSADVSVHYKTKDGSAASGTDYESRSGWIEFLGGGTTKTVRVPSINDAVDQRQETFTLALGSLSSRMTTTSS